MRQPPNTVQKAFKLVSDVEKQLQVADSFKLDFPSYPTAEVNELSAEESSGDEVEVNKISRGKRWGNNNGNYKQKCASFSSNCTFGNKSQYTKPQDNKQGKQWEHKSKDSKITLTQESAHHVLTRFSSNFFRQFNLVMKLELEELKKQEKNSRQVNEITKANLIQAFGITEDQMEKVATILSRNENSKDSGNLSA